LAEAQLSVTEKTRITEQKILELNKRISESETTSGRKEDLARENKKVAQANLDLKRIAAKLNVDIAKSGEQSFAPFAPFSGKIEALFVSKGDIVTPGMKIATVIGSTPKSVIRAEIPSSLALSINPSGRHIATTPSGEKVPLTLNHLSASAISANAFQATFSIADTEASVLGDTSILVITIALQSVGNTFIPLSSVEITRNSVTTVIIRDGKAKQIAVIPGQTLGNFIEITDGLASGDRIILDRSIREGDAIEIK
ncbi:MAG: HlyD family efflux transporter periplasmic adaptor subunit, partial [Candidatus Moranbacteria bacterium]|nr:HlyD family efflux transporter periplasmic adaptor subunit [Candidatus Moranbacteria bacterium]